MQNARPDSEALKHSFWDGFWLGLAISAAAMGLLMVAAPAHCQTPAKSPDPLVGFGPGVATTSSGAACMWTEDRLTGTVNFYNGCSPEIQRATLEAAQKRRTPNAGDFEALNKRLDRLIELLEEKR